MISAIIITKNEEKHIAACIESLSCADEIIVIDDNSTDATQAIAREKGARVISNTFKGYGEQKNVGIAQARYPWLIFLDADERISPELQHEIITVTNTPAYPVYWITVEDIFLGKRLQHLVGHNPRLVQKGSATWNQNPVHEQLIYTRSSEIVRYMDGKSGTISSPIIHHSHETIASYLQKMHRYTSLDAEHMQQTGKHRSGREFKNSWLLPYILGVRQAIKLLFYRKGVLDGIPGIAWSILSGYYEFEMGKKYRSL